MSFTDKLANGAAVEIVQLFHPCVWVSASVCYWCTVCIVLQMCSLTPLCANIQPVFATDAPFVLKMCSLTPLCVNSQPVFATDAPFVLKMCSLTPLCVNSQPVFATDAPFVLKMCSLTPLCVNSQPVFATDAPFVLKMCSLTPLCVNSQPVFATDAPFVLKMCSLTPLCVNSQPVFATDAPFVLKMCSLTPLCVNSQPVFATDTQFVLKMCSLKDKSKVGVIFDMISIKARWEWWCRWNCDLRVINAWKKAFSVIPKASPWCPNHVTICLLRHSGESLQNGQLELRRRNWYFARETHKDTAVSVWACQAGFWKSTGIPWSLWNRTHWSAHYTNERDAAQQESQLVWIV